MNILDFPQRLITLEFGPTRARTSFKALVCIGVVMIGFPLISGASTTQKSSAESLTANFPTSLPLPPMTAIATEINTPEYVIIRPSAQVTFSSEIVAGVDRMNVKEGVSFQKGDILLQFDCRLQKADLSKALAVQMQAKMALESAKKLQSFGSISQYELVKATADSEMANADVDKLQAMVDKCIIIAPFNGAVSEVMVHAHETVKPGDPLLKIISTENLEFEIQIPSSWLAWLHVGSPVNVHLNEIDKKVTAKITRINPEIEPVSESVKMTATISPSDKSLLPGMSGQAEFPEDPENSKSGTKN